MQKEQKKLEQIQELLSEIKKQNLKAKTYSRQKSNDNEKVYNNQSADLIKNLTSLIEVIDEGKMCIRQKYNSLPDAVKDYNSIKATINETKKKLDLYKEKAQVLD